MTKVSVIIPTYNRLNSLLKLLVSLKTEVNNTIELLIIEQVINNSHEIKRVIGKWNSPTTYYLLTEKNFVLALNFGLSKSKGNFVLYLDDDVIVRKNLIKHHLNNYADPAVGAVVGRVITKNQKPDLYNFRTARVSILGTVSNGFSSSIRQEVDTVIGCNMSWRKTALRNIGGFDKNYTGSAIRNETDASLRIKKLGYIIVFDPGAEVYHDRAPTGGMRKSEGRIEWYRSFFSNITYFFLMHRPHILFLLYLLTFWNWFIRCMFGFGREFSSRSMITPVLGIWDGIRKYINPAKYENRS